MGPKPSIRVKVATEDWEFEQIHHLNHQTFVEEIPQHPATASARLVDKFHGENVYIIAEEAHRVVGMLAIRGQRPFSLDQRLPNLDSLLPAGRLICELRLLAVDRPDRSGHVLPALLEYVWRYCVEQGYDLALISGITRQLRLYRHLGFEPFGPLVGTRDALFQPMMLTLERFEPRARWLVRRAATATPSAPVDLPPGVAYRDEPDRSQG